MTLRPEQQAEGLYGSIHRYTWRTRGGEFRHRFDPVFRVIRGSRHSSREFRISKHGYREAYRLAVEEYVRWHGCEGDRVKLLERCPDVELFTDYLYHRTRRRWRQINLHTLRRHLGIDGRSR